MNFLKKILHFSRFSSKQYLNELRKNGATIGEGTVVHYPMNVFIDNTKPYMIKIGKNVQITKNVSILTHDYSWSVLKGKYGEILGACGKVEIGDNVFIGFNTTILKDVKIGDNVIIGANSVVSRDIPSNCVACGSPAKMIMSIEEFYSKRKEAQLKEACMLINEYIKVNDKYPTEEDLREFVFLFKDRSHSSDKYVVDIFNLVGNSEETMDKFLNSSPLFSGLNELIEYAQNKK